MTQTLTIYKRFVKAAMEPEPTGKVSANGYWGYFLDRGTAVASISGNVEIMPDGLLKLDGVSGWTAWQALAFAREGKHGLTMTEVR